MISETQAGIVAQREVPRKKPALSLLLLTKNHRTFLEQSFKRIRDQECQEALEIVHIDSGSTDGTVAFMRDRGVKTHCIDPEEFHHGRTRNLAASLARGEILVLLSADALPAHDQWLTRLIQPFDDQEVGAVYGRQIPPEGMGPVRRRMMESEYPDRPQMRTLAGRDRIHPGWFRFSNVNAAVRTELWRRFPWSESVLLAEDQGLCRDVLEAGMKVVYDPEAAVIHGHERTLWEEFRFAVDNSISLTRLHILGNARIKGEFGYGFRRMGRDTTHFLRKRQLAHTLRSLLVCIVKWLGVQIGKKDGRLPDWLLRRLSTGYGARSG